MNTGIILPIISWVCAGILPAGCAAGLVTVDSPSSPTETSSNSKSRTTSALAFEHYIKAQLYEKDGRLRDAIQEMRQALVYDHGSVFLHTRLGELAGCVRAEVRLEGVCGGPLGVG